MEECVWSCHDLGYLAVRNTKNCVCSHLTGIHTPDKTVEKNRKHEHFCLTLPRCRRNILYGGSSFVTLFHWLYYIIPCLHCPFVSLDDCMSLCLYDCMSPLNACDIKL